jgi:hypothetical protein
MYASLRIFALAAIAAGAFAADAPKQQPRTAASAAEVSGFAVKSLQQLTAEVNFQKAQIEALKAQISKYEELIAAPAVQANREAGVMLLDLQKKHAAEGCELNTGGDWRCPEPKKK